jgi:hypothetical protein
MQRCPKCGVRNLDSDIVCFNCEEILSGPAGVAAAADFPAVPDVESTVRRPKARTSFLGLVLGALLYKFFLLLLAFGLFCIVALLVMWLAYDNTFAAVTSFIVLGAAFLFALFYPDIARARLNGRMGGFVAFLSDLVILLVIFPPILYIVNEKVNGAAGYVLDYYWVIIGLLAEAFLIGFFFGFRAWRRDRQGKSTPEPLEPPEA